MLNASVSTSCLFFQAEDGIRDGTVTGVQTCALPISAAARCFGTAMSSVSAEPPNTRRSMAMISRSEERRVGKECRSRWATYQSKKSRSARELQWHDVDVREGVVEWIVQRIDAPDVTG